MGWAQRVRGDELLQVIVLAAGSAHRLGRDKALLPWPHPGRPLVLHVVGQFPPERVARIIVVTNPRNRTPIRAVLPPNAATALNADPQGDMLSSVRCGIAAADARGGPLCIQPVDVFAVAPQLVARLHDAWHKQPERIHVPKVCGRRAHPLVVPTAFIRQIQQIAPGQGLNQLLRRNPQSVVEHAWQDATLLADIDTPQEYERYRPHRA